MKSTTVKVTVMTWVDELECPKCLRLVGSEETDSSAFHSLHIEYTDLLMLTCRNCGFNWLMETADAT